MKFYDAHMHQKNMECGGFLIGGYYGDGGVLNNQDILSLHDDRKQYIAFYHVDKRETSKVITHKYLKYHSRLEKYTCQDVCQSIKLNQPKCVILDTLNEPFWQSKDYWDIARMFPTIKFVMAHSGGYSINEFLKICHFQDNVYLDFSYTQNLLGGVANDVCLPYVSEAIVYAMRSVFKERILFGSDYPWCQQTSLVKFYEEKEWITSMNCNFLNLLETIL